MRNPKLLSLLRQGCEIRYPSGFFMKGIVDRNFIESGFYHDDTNVRFSLDYYIMNEHGLESILELEEAYSDNDRDDKELALQERKEEMG